jgi:FixJ family two-component response regulator
MDKVNDVFIIDDDKPARESLALLLRTCGLQATTFESGYDFLEVASQLRAGCIILDVRMPDISGLSLHEMLLKQSIPFPVIFVTAHGDVRMAVETMASGAFYFLTKPYREQEIIDKVQEALLRESGRLHYEAVYHEKEESISLLTNREKEVIELISVGLPNKAIAYKLGISERTIEVHRSNMMKKVEVNNVAELINWYAEIKSHIK